MVNNFNIMKSITEELELLFLHHKFDLDSILDIVEKSIFTISEIEFIYDNNDLILTLEIPDEDEFIGEIRIETYNDIINNIYCYRI